MTSSKDVKDGYTEETEYGGDSEEVKQIEER